MILDVRKVACFCILAPFDAHFLTWFSGSLHITWE